MNACAATLRWMLAALAMSAGTARAFSDPLSFGDGVVAEDEGATGHGSAGDAVALRQSA